MTTKKALQQRWNTLAGKIACQAIENALRHGTDQNELRGYLKNVPHQEDVLPHLDLRGIRLPRLLAIRKTDLSKVRFDYAVLSWNFSGSNLEGACFDGAEGKNVDFGGCNLSGASFKKARLPGAIFFSASLRNCDMSGIKLYGGQLKGADCRGAVIAQADLRMVWMADADLRGADMSETDMTGASLGNVNWDHSTKFDHAILSWEGAPAEICTFASAHGARIVSEKGEWERALFDATVNALQHHNANGKLNSAIKVMQDLRHEEAEIPGIQWITRLQSGLSQDEWHDVELIIQKAASNLGLYADV